MRSQFVAAIIGTLLLVSPAQEDDKLPSAQYQEILIKTSLLRPNDANLTGNYAVLHAELAKPFRDQFTPEQLKQAFKTFADQKPDWGLIATKPPIASSEAKIDSRGGLKLRHYFDTRPNRLSYELDFLSSVGEWSRSS